MLTHIIEFVIDSEPRTLSLVHNNRSCPWSTTTETGIDSWP